MEQSSFTTSTSATNLLYFLIACWTMKTIFGNMKSISDNLSALPLREGYLIHKKSGSTVSSRAKSRILANVNTLIVSVDSLQFGTYVVGELVEVKTE